MLLSLLVGINSDKTVEGSEMFVRQFVEQIFAKYDANHDGKLSFEEYYAVAKSTPEMERLLTLGIFS